MKFINFLKDLFGEPGKDKWSLGRITFVIILSVMLAKYGIIEEVKDIPTNWMTLLVFLFGYGKYSSYKNKSIEIEK